jgi:hypothetical protein
VIRINNTKGNALWDIDVAQGKAIKFPEDGRKRIEHGLVLKGVS